MVVPYRLVSREERSSTTVIHVGATAIGASEFVLIAGPCSVESWEQMMAAAQAVRAAGGGLLRGGAYKPRTSPYGFQGLGEKGLELLAEAGAAVGLPVITEVLEPSLVDVGSSYADVLQIGSPHMAHPPRLRGVGPARGAGTLKRGQAR